VVIELAGNAWRWDIEAEREAVVELLRQGVRLYRRQD